MRSIALLAALWAGQGAQDTAQDQAAIQELIQLLGHHDPDRRDAATQRLAEYGRKAWQQLRDAGKQKDPEIRARAADLLLVQRLRRQIPYRILEKHPGAVDSIRSGSTHHKLSLIRTLGRNYSQFRELLHSFLADPDPQILLRTAEALQNNRDRSWVPIVLNVHAKTGFPDPRRALELLSSASSSIRREDMKNLFQNSSFEGRIRLLELSTSAGITLQPSRKDLRAFLQSGERNAILATLTWIRTHDHSALLTEVHALLESSDDAILENALYTLRSRRSRLDAGRILRFLRHDCDGVREEAFHFARMTEDKIYADEFRRLLTDPSVTMRRRALRALWELVEDEALDDTWNVFLTETGEPRDYAMNLLLRRRGHVQNRLSKLAKDPRPSRRMLAAMLELRLEGPRCLESWVADSDESIRRWVLDRARGASTKVYQRILARLSDDNSESIRFEAIRELSRRGNDRALARMRDYVKSKEYSFRLEAVRILLAMDGNSLTLAAGLVKDEDAHIARLGLQALDQHRSYEHITEAAAHLAAQDRRLRKCAASYLRNAATRGHSAKVVATVIGQLDKLNPDVYETALGIVLRYGNRNQARALRPLIGNNRPGQERLIRALALWSEGDTVEVLLSFGDSVDAVLRSAKALSDGEEKRLPRSQRTRVKESLKKGKLLDFIRGNLSADSAQDRRTAARFAGEALLDGAIPSLRLRLRDRSPAVRHAALLSLVALKDSEADYASLLDDPDPDIRTAASEALSALAPTRRRDVERMIQQEDCTWVRRRVYRVLKKWPATPEP